MVEASLVDLLLEALPMSSDGDILNQILKLSNLSFVCCLTNNLNRHCGLSSALRMKLIFPSSFNYFVSSAA